MVVVQHKLQQSTGIVFTNKQVWNHLKELYDLATLVS